MKETKIYRLEHPTITKTVGNITFGVGPYYLENRYDEITKELLTVITKLGDEHSTSSEHPSLASDISYAGFDSNDFYYDVLSACPTLTTLKYWFNGFIDNLLDYGLIIVEYTVSNSYLGNSNIQCGFKLSDVISKKIIA